MSKTLLEGHQLIGGLIVRQARNARKTMYLEVFLDNDILEQDICTGESEEKSKVAISC